MTKEFLRYLLPAPLVVDWAKKKLRQTASLLAHLIVIKTLIIVTLQQGYLRNFRLIF